MLTVELLQSKFSPYVHVESINNQPYNGILKPGSLNLWREQISCTYRSCRWSKGEPSSLGQDVYTVNFLSMSLHSILAKSKSKVILISQTEPFIKLNAKPVLEMNNEIQKPKIKLMCWTFLNRSPPPSPQFFENRSNLWSKTGVWQHPSSRSSVAVVLLLWSCFEFLCQFELTQQSLKEECSKAEKARTMSDATKGKRSISLLPHHKYQHPQNLLLLHKSVQFSEKHEKSYLPFKCEI